MVALILLGGVAPVALAYFLGRLCLRKLPVPGVIAFAVGAVIESHLVFAILALGQAVAQAAILTRRMRALFAAIFGLYGLLYLVHAIAPEIQPDGITYHLGLTAEYARLGRFPDRIAFFEILPQGVEMLFVPAFLIGKHSAAKLVHFFFLIATVPLMVATGRKLNLPDAASVSAAALYVCAPVVGLTGTSAYTDCALAFFALAAFYLLMVWRETGDDRYLLPAGLIAGFCYAIKISGAIVPLLIFATVLATRRFKPAAMIAAGAALSIAPWMVRAYLATGNPVAPLMNSVFPNPFFHLFRERELAAGWTAAVAWWRTPWELAAGGALHGIFGPVFLLSPVALLSLRKPAGRWLLATAALLAIPWLANSGSRFLMPCLPFLALAMTSSLPSAAAAALAVIQALTAIPPAIPLYSGPQTWRLKEFPLRAALRLEPEQAYLRRTLWEWEITDLLRQRVKADEPVFSLLDVPRAYTTANITEWWQSALGDRLIDTMNVASLYSGDALYQLRAEWPPQLITGIRYRLNTAHPGEWCAHEIRLYSGEDRIHNSPRWQLLSWPNRWEAPLAFDDNMASRWRTWQPMRAGMFFHVVLDRPQRTSSAVLLSHTPVHGVPIECYVRGIDGQWRLISSRLAASPAQRFDLRRAAIRHIRAEGFRYLLAPTEYVGAWNLGARIAGHESEWGVEHADRRGFVHLLRIP